MFEESVEKEVFTLPAVNMERLIREVRKLNKRADKLGFPNMSINVIEKRLVPDPRLVSFYQNERQRSLFSDELDALPKVEIMDVTLDGEPPKIEGYEFVGTLDHYSIPGSVIVQTVPGQTVPKEFHNRDATCDHCDKKRYRTETFVLREEETDQHLAVGRQCVRDFIGYDVAALARFLKRWQELTSSFEDEGDERWWGGRITPLYNKQNVLAYTFGTIRVKGWRAKSACQDGETPTSAHVRDIVDPPVFTGRGAEERRAAYNAFVADVKDSFEEDLEKATAAIEWLDTQQDSNEYMHNLKTLRDAEAIPLNMFGYWCSLAAAYERAMDRLKVETVEKEKLVNEWAGNVKERVELTVKIQKLIHINGAYGLVTLHRMIDDKGRTVVWFANTNSGMEEDRTYKIKGTIKKLDEYNEWKQTNLSRVTMLEELTETKK